jgi:IS30 family transposase
MSFSQLTPEKRERVEFLHNVEHKTQQEIADDICVNQSTISRELRKGRLAKSTFYSAHKSHGIAYENKKVQRKPIKIDKILNPDLYNLVITELKDEKSPDLISGQLPLNFPDRKDMRASSEAIYQFIYAYENRGLELWKYLYFQKPKRRKQTKRGQKILIKDRISIDERPEEVNSREIAGHFEGDSIVGKTGTKAGIHTEVERTSRMLFAKVVKDLTAEEGIRAGLEIFTEIPPEMRLSTTYDNGHEHAYHYKLKEMLEMDTFFADPYSSWQRGSNERKNRDIRRYYPKGYDFTNTDQKELDYIVHKINNRPMKVLGYKTPQEVWDEQLAAKALQN